METFNRRDFIRTCALGAGFLASSAIIGGAGNMPGEKRGPANLSISLDRDWLFGGKFVEGADAATFNDAAFSPVTLPHCVAKLSWHNWKTEDWQDIWIYRRHFRVPEEFKHRRVFMDFDRVMLAATPVLNGNALPERRGPFLPFNYEVTSLLQDHDNVLAVKVDSRWLPIPPAGKPKGPSGCDYYLPGGIIGSVSMRAMPQIFISDVFAKPVNVLQPDRSVEITCSLDAAMLPEKSAEVRVDLLLGKLPIATVSKPVKLEKTGITEVKLKLEKLDDIKLWDLDTPHLYNVTTTLLVDEKPVHDHQTRIGFREARFEVEGFFLNGRKLRLFGLNRHELYPYVGYAMPPRVMRKDVMILKKEFNCNIVRCSHYPQTESFLDACDEAGLMVWEEPPGWGYMGDDAWKELVVRDVREMVLRDRNHPGIVIWGVRVNESPNDPPLYKRTTEIAKTLDGSRPCSGSMTTGSRGKWKENWHEDVFAFDDYESAKDGSVGVAPPTPGVPYMLAEAVGQFTYGLERKGFQNIYRRTAEPDLQSKQAIYHAQVHSRAAGMKNFCGVIAWCGFEYASPLNQYQGIKYPGVCDTFRIPKLGATFYQAQVSPKIRPVIKANFYWDFGPQSPHGPGKNAAIFSNCEQLAVYFSGKQIAKLDPDRKNYPHLEYPPFFCDLELGLDKLPIEPGASPELRIDGYVDGKVVISKSFSSDKSLDGFMAAADDPELHADGIDATRVYFCVTDKYGEHRPFAEGEVKFTIDGPGVIVGDNPFLLADSGGVGAVWVKSVADSHGTITLKAKHSTLGEETISIKVR